MNATQMINDSILESDEEFKEEESENKRGEPLATLRVLKNDHVLERDIPLFLGENVLGRDPYTCNVLLPSPSISKQHATISISAYKRRGEPSEVDVEALIWDLGSLNGTRKGRLKLTPNVRYALSECDNLMVADIPCQYVSCSAHKVASSDQFMMPLSRVSVDDSLKEERCSGKKSANGTPESGRRTDVHDGGENLLSTYLFFEQTPAQSQKTLVPESDLDSDEEGGVRGDGKCKTLASLSDSDKSTPTSSHLLSPLNQTVPESEDESPIAPSDVDKNRPLRRVGLNEEEADAYVGGQGLKKQEVFAFVGDSDDEEEEKDERVAMEQIQSEKNSLPLAANEEDGEGVQVADESLVSTPAVSPIASPAFNMDNDTDVDREEKGGEEEEEEEEEREPSAPRVTSSTNQEVNRPTETKSFHMDSDADVDEDDENEVPGCLPSAKPAIRAEDIYMDSDTDVEDDAEKKEAPEVPQSAHTGVAAAQLKDFNLDSDSDVDEELENVAANQTPSKLDTKAVDVKPSPNAPPPLQTDSETDDEAAPTAVRAKVCGQKSGAEDSPPIVAPVAVTSSSLVPAALSGSEADTDVEESSGPPVGNRVCPTDLHLDSDTDVDDEDAVGVATDDQVPSPCKSPGFQNPPLQKCSTPVHLPEKVENMETQAFLTSSSPPFQGSKATASSQEDHATFVLQVKEPHIKPLVSPESSGEEGGERSAAGASFQLGLSDSSHLQERAQALAMESTQAFVLAEEADWGPSSSPHPVVSENDARQVCVEDGDNPQQGIHGNVALDATQAYAAQCSDSEDETDDDEARDIATMETQAFSLPTSFTLAMAETQPMCVLEEGNHLEERENEAGPLMLKHGNDQTERLPATQPVPLIDEEEITDEDSMPLLRRRKAKPLPLEEEQTQPLASCNVDLLATQPVSCIDDDDDNDEDSIPLLRKRKAKPLEQLEEEQTQPLSSCDLTLDETQPVHLEGRDEQSDEDELLPGPRRKQTRPLPSQDEETQTLVGSDPSAGTQPSITGEDGDSDDDGSVIGFSRRKSKPLESQEEESQTLSLTASEEPPVPADDLDDSEAVGSSPRLPKRKVRPLATEEEDSHSLTDPAVSAVGTRLSETEAAGQGGGDASQSESMGGTLRSSRARTSKLRDDEDLESASCAETPQKQTGEKLSPNPNETRNVEKTSTAKKQAKGKTNKKQEEVEANKVPGGLTNKQQVMQIDNSEQQQDMKQSQEKKIAEREREGKTVSKKEKKPELEHEAMVKQRKENEDKEKSDREEREKLQMDNKKEDKERLELEKAEKEQKKLQGEEKERLVGERQEKEENGTKAQLGRKSSARAKREVEEKSIDHQRETQPSVVAARGRRATRRTIAAVPSAEPEQQATGDDIPGRRTRSRSNSSNSVSSERSTAGLDSQQSLGRGRGRGRGSRKSSKPPGTIMTSSYSGRKSTTTTPQSKRNPRARSQVEVKNECTEAQVSPSASAEGKRQGRGRKRTSGAELQNVSGSSCKISKEEEEETKEEMAQDEVPALPTSGGRGRAKRVSAREKPAEVEVKNDGVVAAGGRRVRGRSLAANQERKEEQDVNGGSAVEPEPPRTPVGGASRKRQACASSSPAAKTPRSSSTSPASRSRSRSACPTYKVLFTGVVDQKGEKVLARLGGCMANGVVDMTCLVTDKVRRTVKFLCALAKGVPIVTTDWLEKCGKAGSFLPTEPFLVKDPEQEKKFNFCLLDSLKVASSQPLLQGYKIHVTKSVKPEPVHMKDIFSCSGATFLAKMPSSHKPQTVVVSCEEDWQLCAPALSASVPVVTAEFILTGILQQKLDVQTNLLSSPANIPQPVGGRGQSRTKN